MKIDRVIFSCNADPLYYEFWNPISRLFKKKFNIEPILILCSDKNLCADNLLSTEFGEINQIPIVQDVPEYLQATWARFYYTQLFPNETCLTGEIDRFPLSNKFLTEHIKEIDENAYIHLNADGYRPGNFEYWKSENPGCTVPAYNHLAKGRVFQAVYQFKSTWEEELKVFSKSLGGTTHYEKTNWNKWCLDEVYSTAKLLEYYKNNGTVITPDYPQGRGINRPSFYYDKNLLRSGHYIYCHSLRPYSTYKIQIDEMLQIVLEG